MSAAVRLELPANVDWTYKLEFSQDHSTPPGSGLVAADPNALGPGLAPLLSAVYSSNSLVFAGAERPDAVNNSFTTPAYQRFTQHSLTGTFRINDSMTVKDIAAYAQSYVFANDNITGAGGLKVAPAVASALETLAGFPAGSFGGLIGSPVVLTDSQAAAAAQQWSDELQFNYSSKYVDLTLGALYFHLITNTGEPGLALNEITFSPVPGGVIAPPPSIPYNYAENSECSLAGYGQAEVHLLSQLDFVAGYRQTHDRKRGTNWVNGNIFPVAFDESKPSYSLGFNYKPVDSTLVYGKYSTAFVSGGAVGDVPYRPESVWSWEIGAKSDLLEHRLRVNLATYYAKYHDLQTTDQGVNIGKPELAIVVIDQGTATAKGAEFELSALPIRGVTLNAGLGYTNVVFDTVNPILGTPSTFLPALRPRWTANLGGEYLTQPLFDGAQLAFQINGTFHSKILQYAYVPVPENPGPIYSTPASWIGNARIALQDIKLWAGEAEVALWSRNFTNNGEILFPIAFGNPPYVSSTTYQPARTFGIDVNYKF